LKISTIFLPLRLRNINCFITLYRENSRARIPSLKLKQLLNILKVH